MAAVRRGVMGGTFDPVHRGHLELARYAQRQLGLDEVLWIPAGDPWRKTGQRLAPAPHRLAMVELAIDGERTWRVSTLEIDRPGPTYTVDTLERLQADHPGDHHTLILGQDALEDLPNWHEPDRLIALADVAAAQRRDRAPSADELDALVPGLSRRVTWLDMPLVPFSSTQVRELAASGTPLSGFVPAGVEAYIKEHRLYRAN